MKNLNLLFVFSYSLCHLSMAQDSPVAEKVPHADIAIATKSQAGEMLFAVRIYASKSGTLYLGGKLVKPLPGGPTRQGGAAAGSEQLPFSLNGSTLKDLNTGQIYANLPALPPEPFYGPMEALTSVLPGGWIQLGIAFPSIPLPPPKDGKKQPYLLLFSIPALKIETNLKLDPDTLKPMR